MGGHCIPNTRIAVDYWEQPTNTDKVHFLTNCHSTNGLTSAWRKIIFTSPINAKFLTNVIGIDRAYVRPLAVDKWHSIRHKKYGVSFTVALIPANYVAGSVMFLFEGSFGKILYTGYFCSKPRMFKDSPLMTCLADSQDLDVLYVDNLYAACNCKFQSREKCIQQVAAVVRAHPKDSIVLAVPYEENVLSLTNIAEALKLKIAVSRENYRLMREILDDDQACLFTDNPAESSIRALDLSTLADNWKDPQGTPISPMTQFSLRSVEKREVTQCQTAAAQSLQK